MDTRQYESSLWNEVPVTIIIVDQIVLKFVLTMCMDLYLSVMGQQSCLQVTDITQEHATRVLSQHQKFHRAQLVTNQLAALCSERGMVEYEERLAFLELLKEKWSNGHKVTLQAQSGDSRITYHTYKNGYSFDNLFTRVHVYLSLIHIWRCRRRG